MRLAAVDDGGSGKASVVVDFKNMPQGRPAGILRRCPV